MNRLALDARTRKPRGFEFSRRAEEAYARNLRKIARHIGDIVNGFVPDNEAESYDYLHEADSLISRALQRYSDMLAPWAESAARQMISDVDKRDARVWMSHSERIGRALKREVEETETGRLLRQRLADQVGLITSLPTDAAKRVHELTLNGLVDGRRASEVAAEIMKSGHVSRGRADLIARTETARTASVLTEVRAKALGCTHFVWKSARDAQVRPSHRKVAGQTFAFSDPPIVDGQALLPGQIFNCRCWISPVIPDSL